MIKKHIQSVQSRPEFVKLVKTVFQLSGDKLVKVLVGLAVQTWMARYLGPVQLGKVNYVAEFSYFFSLVVGFGLDDHILRVLTSEKADLETNVNRFLGTRLFIALCTFSLSVIAAYLLKGHDLLFFGMLCLFSLVLFTRAFETLDIYYQSRLNVAPLVFAKQAAYGLSSVAKIGAILAHLSWPFFVVSNLLEFVTGRLLVIRQFRKNHFNFNLNFHKKDIKDTLVFGTPFFFISVFFFLEFKIGVFLAGPYIGAAEIGILAITINLLAIADFFSQVIFSSTFPAILNARNTSHEKYKSRFQWLLIVTFLNFSLLGMGSLLFGKFFVHLLFGDAYLEVASLLPWGCFFLFLNSFNMLRLRWFMLESSVKDWLWLHGLAFGLALIIQIIYLADFGLKLVFVSVIVSHLVTSLLSLLSKRHRESLLFFLKK